MGCGAATGRVAPEMTEGQRFREMRVSAKVCVDTAVRNGEFAAARGKVCVDTAVRNGQFTPVRMRVEKAKLSLQSNDNFASVVESLMKMCWVLTKRSRCFFSLNLLFFGFGKDVF